jgi:hypothetical protein
MYRTHWDPRSFRLESCHRGLALEDPFGLKMAPLVLLASHLRDLIQVFQRGYTLDYGAMATKNPQLLAAWESGRRMRRNRDACVSVCNTGLKLCSLV